MAVIDKSLFLYGFTVLDTNQNIPFRGALAGPELNAVVPVADYTLATLLAAIKLALQEADPAHIYTVTANRTLSSNTQNRITIATNGTYLDLLFSTGATASTSIRTLITFGATDRTGATTYTNSATSGTSLQPAWWAKNYQSPDSFQKNIGNTSMSANGLKETVSWSIQRMITCEFQHESQADMLAYWAPLMIWMIKTKPFEFTPNISVPATVYSCTLDKTSVDGKGLSFMMKEQLPDFPFRYTTGPMQFSLLPE